MSEFSALLTMLQRLHKISNMEDQQKLNFIIKQKLTNLYIDQRKTSEEIANILNCSPSTILNYLKKYEIKINKNIRKYEGPKIIPFSEIQKEILVGTLLGDGSIEKRIGKNKSSYRLLMHHCEKQKDLLLWKKEQFSDYINCIRQNIDKKNNKKSWQFSSIVHDEFKKYYELFYKNDIKTITEEIEDHITNLSLAVWYFDDGSLKNKTNIKIATHGYSKNENEILSYILLKKFGILTKVCKDQKYYYLFMRKEASIKFLELTEQYAIECMNYKFNRRTK